MAKRGHGEGSIVKRKDGTWQGSISYIDPIAEKRKRPTIYGRSRGEVKEKLIKMQSDLQDGINISPDKITVGAWINTWLTDYSKPVVRQGTWEGYHTNYKNHIKPGLGHIALNKLATSDLQRFYKEKLESGRADGRGGLSATTVRLIHVVIYSALEQAKTEGRVVRNVAEFVKLPAKTKKEITPLSQEQMIKFLQHIKKERLYTLFALELGTGMRRGEILGLQWGDIDLATGECHIKRSLVKNVSNTVSINDPKTKSSKRNIYIPNSVLVELAKHKQAQSEEKMKYRNIYNEGDWVFCHLTGEPLEPRAFTKYYARLLKKAGIPHVSFHTLRHSVATALLDKDVHIKKVSSLLGHSSIAITADIYSHTLEKNKQEIAATMDEFLQQSLQQSQK